jgi:hypothetical protein
MAYADQHSVLGLKAGATPQEIKTAYRTYVKFFHPDRFQDDEARRQFAEQRMKEINAAYEYLQRNRYQTSPPLREAASQEAANRQAQAQAQAAAAQAKAAAEAETKAAQAQAAEAQAKAAQAQAAQAEAARGEATRAEAAHRQQIRPSLFHRIAMGPVGDTAEWIAKAYMGVVMGIGLLGALVTWVGGAWSVAIGLGIWVLWLKLTSPAMSPAKCPRTISDVTVGEYTFFSVGMGIVWLAFLVGRSWGCLAVPIYLWFSWAFLSDVRVNRRIRQWDSDAASFRYAQYMKMGWTPEKANDVINRIRQEGTRSRTAANSV